MECWHAFSVYYQVGDTSEEEADLWYDILNKPTNLNIYRYDQQTHHNIFWVYVSVC